MVLYNRIAKQLNMFLTTEEYVRHLEQPKYKARARSSAEHSKQYRTVLPEFSDNIHLTVQTYT